MAELRLCTHACPTVLARDCRRWAAELEGDLARIVVVVRSSDGAEIASASLSVDGEPLIGATDSGARVADPGSRVLRAEAPGFRPATRRIELSPGELATIEIVLEPHAVPKEESATPKEPISRDPPALGFVVGGAGIALLGLGATLAIKGHLDVSDLRDECAPRCDEAEVDSVRALWIGGGVAAGTGLIAVSIATWLFVHPELQTSGVTWVPEIRFHPEGGAAAIVGSF
jgi:hypothetical protein